MLMINISPSNIFLTMRLVARFHHAVSIYGLTRLSANLLGRSKMAACCLNSSGEAMLTTIFGPNQNEAISPNWSCNSMRNSCRLPAFPISPRFPSLQRKEE